ncbi:MAG TPA: OmpA family protein [Ignavibacteria bacterium]
MKIIKQKNKSEDNLERWLLTYSDLITLLLGLFVILYASSKVDIEKFKQFSAALTQKFGTGVLPSNQLPVITPLPTQNTPTMSKFDSIKMEIMSSISDMPESEGLSFDENQFGLVIRFKDRLLFETGKADLKPSSLQILRAVAEELKKLPNDLLVEGHTDNVPINTPKFPSNLHLSLYRAINANYFLIHDCGIPPERISVQGYGEYRPIRPNDTEENRALNRRVDIVIVKEHNK